ncbi:MAG: endonuclease/exonuclease/phosphatase family protein [Chloroflexota bacterium]
MTIIFKQAPLKRFKDTFIKHFRSLTAAYGLVIIMHLIAYLATGEQFAIVEFLNTFAHLLWLPVFVILPLCLLLKEWRIGLMLIPAVIAFLLIWGDMLIPNNPPQANDEDTQFRVATYNMLAFNRVNFDYIEILRDVDADLVALQEVDFLQARMLTDNLSDLYPYMAFHAGGPAGQGIMSKYPILEDDYWQYDFLNAKLGHQRVVIELADGQEVVVYNAHPTHPGIQGPLFTTEYRTREIVDLLNRTSQETLPTILMGDFNTPDFSSDYMRLTNQFNDAYRIAGDGLGWTFPRIAGLPSAFIRIDYIFLDDNIQAQDAGLWRDFSGSDHNLLYADLFIEAQN